MCGFCNVWVCVCVDFVMCGCVYVSVLLCVGVFLIFVLVFTVFCIVCTVFCIVSFMYIICFVCTSVRTTATDWKLNCSNNNNNNNWTESTTMGGELLKSSVPESVCRAADEGRDVLNRMKLFELQSRCGQFGEEINSIPCQESKTIASSTSSWFRRYTDSNYWTEQILKQNSKCDYRTDNGTAESWILLKVLWAKTERLPFKLISDYGVSSQLLAAPLTVVHRTVACRVYN